MKIRHAMALGFCGLGLFACAPIRLKAPESVKGGTELKVEGYKQGSFSFKDKNLKIGSYQVGNIDRDWDKGSSVSAGPWSRDASKKAYRYDVSAQGRTLHGECTEAAVAQSVVGFGSSKVTMACKCVEGDIERVSLELVNGMGQAQIAGVPYDMTVLYESEQGATLDTPLGYEFRGAQGYGAVDVSTTGRAWLPSGASEDEQLGLICSYAGFLLYRPTDQ